MKYNIIFSSIICFCWLSSYGQAVENGVVKEYHGKNAKTALSGVELMVHGAPSTVSDIKGAFSLKFATYKPGDPINYSEIYKDGYVIFNKEALDAWRISSNGKPFTIVMCKEADFRQLKKKFYDIIEKSYRSEYERQKEIAERNATDAMQLRQQLQMIEKEYNQKMADINTYVELFSRIDRNEMDSVEAKALDYMEAGEIDKAIKTYEELHLEKTMKDQFSKWDAADEMHKAANNMESEVQSDLTILASKMQKQISLYEMGGYKYRAKKSEMIRNLIALLTKLQPVTGTQYNELLGEMLVKSVENRKPKKQLSALRQAAALPSFAGLYALAGIYELEKPYEQLVDSIHNMYSSALVLIENSNDSLATLIRKKLSYIPDGYYHNEDGNVYPYRLLPDGEAQLVGQGPYYSTHLEGEVKLPDAILVKDSLRSIVSIGENAFGSNLKLRKVTLPAHCKEVSKRAFYQCAPLTIVVNSELQSVYANKPSDLAFPKEVQLVFNSTPMHTEWIAERCETFANDSTVDISPMCIALADYYQSNNDPETAFAYYEYVVEKYLYLKNYEQAKEYAKKSSKIDKLKSHYLMSLCYDAQKDYPAAIDECKKCLSLKNTGILNHLAYLYAKLEPKGDFKRAHATIDQAIELAGSNFEKANFYDSKGEFFLMQGLEDKALECLNKALSLDSQYMSNTTTPSILYSHFNSENSQENEDDISKNKKRREVINTFRNGSIYLMALDFLMSRIEASKDFDYSRLRYAFSRSLGNNYAMKGIFIDNSPSDSYINCLNRIEEDLKNSSKSQKISYNIDWIGIDESDDRYQLNSNAKDIISKLSVYNQLFQSLPCDYLSELDITYIAATQEACNKYKESLDTKKRNLFNYLLEGHSVRKVIKKYGCTTDSISKFINEVGQTISDSWDEVAHEVIESGKVSSINKGDSVYANRYYDEIIDILYQKKDPTPTNWDFIREKLPYYVDVANRVAVIELQNIPEDFLDYEELVSIGLIAIQVLVKNKTKEQIEKYNLMYLATAIQWAIRNELCIRYPLYERMMSHSFTYNRILYDESDVELQKDFIRKNIYLIISQLWNSNDYYFDFNNLLKNGDDISNEVFEEINHLYEAIMQSRNSLSEEYLDCFDQFFAKDADYEAIEESYSPETFHGMLEGIRSYLKSIEISGY